KGGYPCLLIGCDHVADTRANLGTHFLRLDHREPEYACEGCPKRYTRADGLKKHSERRSLSCRYANEKSAK
ncbi:hypothetical protein BDN72DRAFT_746096, partial [Pluteus cervinus]